jgi:polyisoprenoid-binding protein YceI
MRIGAEQASSNRSTLGRAGYQTGFPGWRWRRQWPTAVAGRDNNSYSVLLTKHDEENGTMKNKVMLAVALAGAMVSAQGFAQTSTWAIDPAHSSVNFTVLHLAVSNVHGSFGNVKGMVTLDEKDMTKSTVMATIDTTTVSTGVEARDKHLKSPDFFDIEKNPTMTFKSTSMTKASGKLQLTGDLTLNGMTRSVTLDVDGPTAPQTMNGKTVSGFSASGKLSRKDFNFGSKFGAPMVGDDVKFSIDVEIDKK